MADYVNEIKRRRTFAIISHPDVLREVSMFHPFLFKKEPDIEDLYQMDEPAAFYGFSRLLYCGDEILCDIAYRILNRKLFAYKTIESESGYQKSSTYGNTTIACVVTNAKLDKAQCTKIAGIAHNGYARAIHPVHTMRCV